MPPSSQSFIRPATFMYRAGETVPEHTHSEHQLVYADFGLLCVDTPSSRWVVPPLRALWVPAQTPHAITARVDSEMSTLYLDQTVAVTGLDDVTVISVSPLLRELITHIHQSPPTGPALARLNGVILDHLTTAPTAPLDLPRLRDPRARAIAEALEHDPRDRRTLREFGRDVGASERTLQRLFTAETGSTFGHWRTQLRLQHGVIALGQGHSVSTATTTSGYNEPSAFIAAFRSAFGTTPGRYFADSNLGHTTPD
jgi:AraC-like DNA-binding protein